MHLCVTTAKANDNKNGGSVSAPPFFLFWLWLFRKCKEFNIICNRLKDNSCMFWNVGASRTLSVVVIPSANQWISLLNDSSSALNGPFHFLWTYIQRGTQNGTCWSCLMGPFNNGNGQSIGPGQSGLGCSGGLVALIHAWGIQYITSCSVFYLSLIKVFSQGLLRPSDLNSRNTVFQRS